MQGKAEKTDHAGLSNQVENLQFVLSKKFKLT